MGILESLKEFPRNLALLIARADMYFSKMTPCEFNKLIMMRKELSVQREDVGMRNFNEPFVKMLEGEPYCHG